jgi:type VI protein secretion system component Hcp
MAFRIEKKWRWLVALGAVFVPGVVTGALSLPFTFSAGQPIRASEVNANFEALRAKLDALSAPPVRPSIGTLTLAGIATQLPIRNFSQSVTVPFTAASGSASAKPALSDIQIVLDVGANDPMINAAVSNSSAIASADIALGSLTLHLKSVSLDRLTVGAPQGGLAQETLSIAYKSVDWSWQVGTGPAKLVSFDLASSTGGGSGVRSFNYGYFAPGVSVDSTFTPVSGYTHDVNCPAGAKCAQGALSVQKAIGSETLDELGLATAEVTGLSVTLDWLTAAGSASNIVQLANAVVVGVTLTTQADGTLGESVDFAYQQITWKAGNSTATVKVGGNGV